MPEKEFIFLNSTSQAEFLCSLSAGLYNIVLSVGFFQVLLGDKRNVMRLPRRHLKIAVALLPFFFEW
jgi:hypothetical protein